MRFSIWRENTMATRRMFRFLGSILLVSALTSCASPGFADWFLHDYGGSQLIHNTSRLTVEIRGNAVYNARLDAIGRSAGTTSASVYVSNSRPVAVFNLPDGNYRLVLRVGDRIIDTSNVKLRSARTVVLSMY